MNFKTDIAYRKQLLIKLLNCVQLHEQEIINALYNDFKKPAFEAVISETAYIVSELNHTIKNINKWAKPTMVLPSLLNFPSTDYIYKEPYGKVLIIAPWNYPYQLALCPLIAAVAAGNEIVIKPSELTPNTSKIISKIISETFDENHVKCVEGGVEISQELLTQRWDYIFFTGSVAVGKIVAKAAAENLTPVTLELGGKNPCIIGATANFLTTTPTSVFSSYLAATTSQSPGLTAEDDLEKTEEIISTYKTGLISRIYQGGINSVANRDTNGLTLCDVSRVATVDLDFDSRLIFEGSGCNNKRYLITYKGFITWPGSGKQSRVISATSLGGVFVKINEEVPVVRWNESGGKRIYSK